MNPRRSLGVQSPQEAVKVLSPPPPGNFRQPRAQFFRALRALEKTLEQRPEIEPRPAHDNRQPAALADLCKHARRFPAVVARREDFAGFDHIKQVMRDASSLCPRNLPRPDVKAPVNLHRIAIHDFACAASGEEKRQRGFSCRRGAHNHYQRDVIR